VGGGGGSGPRGSAGGDRSAGDRDALIATLRGQADACRVLGSPLYAHLLDRVIEDVEAGGPAWTVLAQAAHDTPESAPPLRLLGGTHRMALDGRAPALADHYPSTGGDGDPDGAWNAFRALLTERPDEVRAGLSRPVQTNEVGRAAGLLGGFLTVARETGLPLRILELGASAGLNLRWDHFHYAGEEQRWGPSDSPVRLSAAPPLATRATVAERAGCDPAPVDPTTEEGRLTLISYVWPDQHERLARLEGAIALARRVPARVDRAPAGPWAAAKLADPAPGRATVVYHSVMTQYLSREERAELDGVLAAAGERATPDAPLARLAMEPANEMADVRLTVWPGGEERRVARAGYHGVPVEWCG
jgi:hypothetical protein